jgi:hypothetical protein
MPEQHEGQSLGPYVALEDIPAHSIVEIEDLETARLKLADAESAYGIGVVHIDLTAGEKGSPIPFPRYSSHIMRAAGSITTGDVVDQADDGKVQGSTTASLGVGIALNDAADGEYVEVTWVHGV